MNVNVLDKNLNRVGIVMQYTSLIWDKRYRELGDCELYLPATMDMINLLKKGYYLTRDDDDMVCVIRKIEITTDEEAGNMLIVTGVDVRCLFDQRIRPETYKLTNRTVESWIRAVVNALSGAGSAPAERRFYKQNGSSLIGVKANTSLTNTVTMELGIGSVGDEFRNLQALFDYGGRMAIENGVLTYETYKGADRHATVKFSTESQTIKTSDYVDDMTGIKNVAYVSTSFQYKDQATGEMTLSICIYYGTATGIDRYEQISEQEPMQITKSQVESAFPGGSWQTAGGQKIYSINGWSFVVPPGNMRSWIESAYPGVYTFSTSAGVTRATTEYTASIAFTTAGTLASDTQCDLFPLPMMLYYMGKAQEEIAQFPELITFKADAIPDFRYKYKQDYFLGDLVTIQNDFGISSIVRITEVLESWDATGYNLEIKFNE